LKSEALKTFDQNKKATTAVADPGWIVKTPGNDPVLTMSKYIRFLSFVN
jgi:hypothetical protein